MVHLEGDLTAASQVKYSPSDPVAPPLGIHLRIKYYTYSKVCTPKLEVQISAKSACLGAHKGLGLSLSSVKPNKTRVRMPAVPRLAITTMRNVQEMNKAL